MNKNISKLELEKHWNLRLFRRKKAHQIWRDAVDFYQRSSLCRNEAEIFFEEAIYLKKEYQRSEKLQKNAKDFLKWSVLLKKMSWYFKKQGDYLKRKTEKILKKSDFLWDSDIKKRFGNIRYEWKYNGNGVDCIFENGDVYHENS